MVFSSINNKRGVGIVEALIASAALGIMLVALLNFQSGNRDTLLRIRGRDGAVAVAHNVMDSLNAIGLTAVELPEGNTGSRCVTEGPYMAVACNNEPDADKKIYALKINHQMEWKGSPGLVEHTMRVDYRVCLCVTDEGYVSQETSDLRNETHVYAKRLDVKVQWPFKSSVQMVSLTGVIR